MPYFHSICYSILKRSSKLIPTIFWKHFSDFDVNKNLFIISTHFCINTLHRRFFPLSGIRCDICWPVYSCINLITLDKITTCTPNVLKIQRLGGGGVRLHYVSQRDLIRTMWHALYVYRLKLLKLILYVDARFGQVNPDSGWTSSSSFGRGCADHCFIRTPSDTSTK